ncbi:RNA polymerase sigma factor [Flexithrix dorotheae]|uniref:RNA polymerase sigma factor n=1 Tax=Flexithrix dorotheae TaxID=70993 RepID=UPI00035C4EF5|nr:sigma-70 family RNA polymerase sigma factor [Flexithrix dorotheae]
MKISQDLIFQISKKNDSKAFHFFYDFYFDELFQFALSYVKESVVAEEIVSDVFIKIWQNRIQLLEIKNIKAYLYTSIKHQSLTKIRLSLRNRNTDSIDEFSNLDFAVENYTPEYEVLLTELYKILDEAIESLPIKTRQSFHLIRQDQLSYKEVARILDISVSGVEKNVARATKLLIEVLDDYLEKNKDKKGKVKIIKLASFILMTVMLQKF